MRSNELFFNVFNLILIFSGPWEVRTGRDGRDTTTIFYLPLLLSKTKKNSMWKQVKCWKTLSAQSGTVIRVTHTCLRIGAINMKRMSAKTKISPGDDPLVTGLCVQYTMCTLLGDNQSNLLISMEVHRCVRDIIKHFGMELRIFCISAATNDCSSVHRENESQRFMVSLSISTILPHLDGPARVPVLDVSPWAVAHGVVSFG